MRPCCAPIASVRSSGSASRTGRVARSVRPPSCPDGRRAVLPALLPGAGRGRSGARARRPPLAPSHPVRGSGDVSRGARAVQYDAVGMVPRRGGFLSATVEPSTLPSWLTEADLDFYARSFARTGFRGGLTGTATSTELGVSRPSRARVDVPASYVAGDRDLVVAFRRMDQLLRTCGTSWRVQTDAHASRLRALDSAGTARRSTRR